MKKTLTTACVITALLFAGSAHARDITVTWQMSPEPDLDHYNAYVAPIHYAEGTTDSWTQVDVEIPGTATTYTFTDLQDDIDYSTMITAVDTAGNESKLSNLAFEKPDLQRPDVVIEVRIVTP